MAYPQQPPISAPAFTSVQIPDTPPTQVPASPAAEPAAPPVKATAKFSVVDAARVVMRGLSTVTECLCFAGRKVTVYAITLAGWLAGGIKGLFRYAHENLDTRKVQPVPGEQHLQTPDNTVTDKMPLEEYVREDATRISDSLSKAVLTTNKKNPWLSVEGFGGIACAFFTPYFVFGPLATLLNLPRLCGAEPFITFEAPTDTPPATQPLTLPAESNPQQAQPELINNITAPDQSTLPSPNPASQTTQPALDNPQPGPPLITPQPCHYPVNTCAPQSSYSQPAHLTASVPQTAQQDPRLSSPCYPRHGLQNLPSQSMQQYPRPPQRSQPAHSTQQAPAPLPVYRYQPIQPVSSRPTMPTTVSCPVA